jgi:hypothetical protein
VKLNWYYGNNGMKNCVVEFGNHYIVSKIYIGKLDCEVWFWIKLQSTLWSCEVDWYILKYNSVVKMKLWKLESRIYIEKLLKYTLKVYRGNIYTRAL